MSQPTTVKVLLAYATGWSVKIHRPGKFVYK